MTSRLRTFVVVMALVVMTSACSGSPTAPPKTDPPPGPARRAQIASVWGISIILTNMEIVVSKKDFKKEIEIVERKGAGHPDTLADGLAEILSLNFSNYSLKKFGAVLHHNFDKVGLLGGSSYVSFGKGYMTGPIKVLINGRISTKFADEVIPTRKLLVEWTKNFFRERLPLIDPDEDLEILLNLSKQSSPGKTYEKEAKKSARQKWFEPEGLDDLPEFNKLRSNDTSIGVGYAPVSTLEKVVLNIEHTLNSENFRKENPWIGSDIKIMGVKNKEKFNITLCIPQIANHVKDLRVYTNNLLMARRHIEHILTDNLIQSFEISINTRDNYELAELYLTATGSSIESGDEGLAGRGNRVNKVISPTRPMSMEGSCGKNPIYHIGKLYYVAAFDIAEKIFNKFGVENEVFLVSQSGRDLLDPWVTIVNIPENFNHESELRKLVEEGIINIPSISKAILNHEIEIC